nr:bifunctional GNAT family N-acetyltransferase/carbon-nitrogen hydrolase family protein [uncultured Desulfobulbus sp.]
MAKRTSIPEKHRLVIRNAVAKDADAISVLTHRVYDKDMPNYTPEMIESHIRHFQEGQWVATVNEVIVGYSASFRIGGKYALKPHTWEGITGGGYATRHDENGEWLYGMDVCVDPAYRGYKIGQRFYDQRKRFVRKNEIKGIVFGGRLPGLRKRIKEVGSAENYVELAKAGRIRDYVLNFQLRNGFEIIGLMPGYIKDDVDSMGWGTHLVWRNPLMAPDGSAKPKWAGERGRLPATVRVAAVQYEQRRVASFSEFMDIVEFFVDVCAGYKADFVLFPEMFTLQLLSMQEQSLNPADAIEEITRQTPEFVRAMRELALRYNINIIGGSHPTRKEDGRILNIAYIFLRDGQVHEQPKIHPTSNEETWWNVEGGDVLKPIETDCGPIGVLICYDSEFPELARRLTDLGAMMLFVPFCTDERAGYQRVRYCCQARAVENQLYVVMAGNVGNLPRVKNMHIQYAQSCILTPCDFPFARDGIAADSNPNTETVLLADLNIANLQMARANGTVQNLKDRRHDLYTIKWSGR